jgi:hypothetical protein
VFPGCNHYHDGDGDGRDCIDDLKQFFIKKGISTVEFGDALPSSVDVPRPGNNSGVTFTGTWGEWVEAQIRRAIRVAEEDICKGFHTPGMEHNCAIIVRGFGPGGGVGVIFSDECYPNVHRLEIIALAQIVPGYRNDVRAVQSFARATTVGSAMIVHEHFEWRTRNAKGHKPIYGGYYSQHGGFPCIPKEVIESAIEFHRRAVNHMHDVRPYDFPCPTDADKPILDHDVFDHFEEFVRSPRFTNNVSRETEARFYHPWPFGLLFSENPADLDKPLPQLRPERSPESDWKDNR